MHDSFVEICVGESDAHGLVDEDDIGAPDPCTETPFQLNTTQGPVVGERTRTIAYDYPSSPSSRVRPGTYPQPCD